MTGMSTEVIGFHKDGNLSQITVFLQAIIGATRAI